VAYPQQSYDPYIGYLWKASSAYDPSALTVKTIVIRVLLAFTPRAALLQIEPTGPSRNTSPTRPCCRRPMERIGPSKFAAFEGRGAQLMHPPRQPPFGGDENASRAVAQMH
jgi:hypothetical protein